VLVPLRASPRLPPYRARFSPLTEADAASSPISFRDPSPPCSRQLLTALRFPLTVTVHHSVRCPDPVLHLVMHA